MTHMERFLYFDLIGQPDLSSVKTGTTCDTWVHLQTETLVGGRTRQLKSINTHIAAVKLWVEICCTKCSRDVNFTSVFSMTGLKNRRKYNNNIN